MHCTLVEVLHAVRWSALPPPLHLLRGLTGVARGLPFERRGAVRRNSKEKNLKRDLSISRGAALLKEPFFPSQQLSLVCVHCTVLYVSVGCIGNCFFLFQKMYCVVLDRRIVRNAPGVAASSYVSARLAWKRHETLAFPLFPSFTSLYVSKHLTFVCATSAKKPTRLFLLTAKLDINRLRCKRRDRKAFRGIDRSVSPRSKRPCDADILKTT